MKSKLRYLLMGALFLILTLSEHCIGPLWWGCNPPYSLCAVAVCAMFSGEKVAALVGLGLGLFADSMTAGAFGTQAILYMFFGYTVAFFAEKILSRNVFSCILAGTVCVALSEVAAWGILCLSNPIPFASASQYVLIPRIAMGFFVLPLLYGVFYLLYREQDNSPTARRR